MIEDSGLRIPDLMVLAKLAVSKSDARRLIEGGGVFVGEDKVTAVSMSLKPEQIEGEGVILRKGKKSFCRIRKV
jgi:tyrosyl-tRNA synthetase